MMNLLIRQQLAAVTSAISRTNELYGRWAKRHGLNYNSLMILYAIFDKKSCTQKQICEELLIPKQTVHTICMELKENGYLAFQTDPGDKREKRLQFTEIGCSYAKKILDVLYALEESAMQKMGEDLCAHLVASNEQFCKNFEFEVNHEQLSIEKI